jgi:hypothetical protein
VFDELAQAGRRRGCIDPAAAGLRVVHRARILHRAGVGFPEAFQQPRVMQPRQEEPGIQAQCLNRRPGGGRQIPGRFLRPSEMVKRDRVRRVQQRRALQQLDGPGRVAVAHRRQRNDIERFDVVG